VSWKSIPAKLKLFVISPRLQSALRLANWSQEFSVVRFNGDKAKADAVYAGCEPLTPDDIAEVVVFAAGRRENVVLADSLIFPNHQVSFQFHKASVLD
jgi:NADP-dependent 3-hydroxy acid dehydrogenase YdfG